MTDPTPAPWNPEATEKAKTDDLERRRAARCPTCHRSILGGRPKKKLPIEEIKKASLSGDFTMRELAKDYNVSVATIHAIKKGTRV